MTGTNLTEERLKEIAQSHEWTTYGERSKFILELLHGVRSLQQRVNTLQANKPRLVVCHPCKGASPADDYVGMHMSNEECPACRNTEIAELRQQVKTLTESTETAVYELERLERTIFLGLPEQSYARNCYRSIIRTLTEALQSKKGSPREERPKDET